MYIFVSIHGVLIIKLEYRFNIQHYNINILLEKNSIFAAIM